MTDIFEFKFNKTTSILLVALTILLLVTVQNVLAGPSNTIPKYGFLGGVNVYATVRSFQIPGASNGSCEISSSTSPSTTINVIGWTWWQCDTLFNGAVLNSANFSGYAPSGSSSGTSTTINNAFINGNGLKSHGTHDFNHNNSNPSPWRPYNVNVYP